VVSETAHDHGLMAGLKDRKKAMPTEKNSKDGSKSLSRSPRRHASPSLVHRGRSQHHGRELVVRERVARDISGGAKWLILTSTN
jgi:uncharacterized protein involved in copper resistance